jgi:hypothetical protein
MVLSFTQASNPVTFWNLDRYRKRSYDACWCQELNVPLFNGEMVSRLGLESADPTGGVIWMCEHMGLSRKG